MTGSLKAGVIGVGYWGPNIVRNLGAHRHITVKYCADLNQERLDWISSQYPGVTTTQDYEDIVRDEEVMLVAICTPVFTHYDIAKAALQHGKHILIEKPMASTTAQAEELIALAEERELKIFVDHTFVFTGAVSKIKELVDSGEMGDLYYFDSVRVNLGLFQRDVNVLWDLAPHDISIMHYLFNQYPESVIATGADHVGNGLEDIAYLTVYYPNNLIAHIHSNWLSPVKIRQTLLAGSRKMVVWDDVQPSEKVKIYDKGIDVIETNDDVYKSLIQYRSGDMSAPKIDQTEALKNEVDHIYDCLVNDQQPIIGGEEGKMVVRILEAAQESIKNRGVEVKI